MISKSASKYYCACHGTLQSDVRPEKADGQMLIDNTKGRRDLRGRVEGRQKHLEKYVSDRMYSIWLSGANEHK